MKRYSFLARFLSAVVVFLFLCGCADRTDSPAGTDESDASAALFSLEQSDLISGQSSIEEPGRPAEDSVQTGLIAEQILEGETGEIHYSYYLPEDYREDDAYPMMVVMPGYDMMWFGEESSGSNLDWRGFLCWTELSEDIIVVSAQLTDWRETSARQAIELTEYFLTNFSVDESRVYAAGYSAGGETMSRAVSMRPDLYAAYLHGASQWDGEFDPIAENGVAVYIFMAENDEYYGSQKAWDAYSGLYAAYENAGWTERQINKVLQLEIPDNQYFNERGITGNYHGGGNILFEDRSILDWILSHRK